MFDFEIIKDYYAGLSERVDFAKNILKRPLTYTEKILYSHLFESKFDAEFLRTKSYVEFAPDRVAMQDATAQMALLQFIMAGKNKVAVPTTVHADHLIQAKVGSFYDLKNALADKVSSALDDAKVDVAKSVFTGQQGVQAPEANPFTGNDQAAETPAPEVPSDEVAQ